jgi:peptidoglycan/xylan/chitin deacetylase (PgdA/CDA1 family)
MIYGSFSPDLLAAERGEQVRSLATYFVVPGAAAEFARLAWRLAKCTSPNLADWGQLAHKLHARWRLPPARSDWYC